MNILFLTEASGLNQEKDFNGWHLSGKALKDHRRLTTTEYINCILRSLRENCWSTELRDASIRIFWEPWHHYCPITLAGFLADLRHSKVVCLVEHFEKIKANYVFNSSCSFRPLDSSAACSTDEKSFCWILIEYACHARWNWLQLGFHQTSKRLRIQCILSSSGSILWFG